MRQISFTPFTFSGWNIFMGLSSSIHHLSSTFPLRRPQEFMFLAHVWYSLWTYCKHEDFYHVPVTLIWRLVWDFEFCAVLWLLFVQFDPDVRLHSDCLPLSWFIVGTIIFATMDILCPNYAFRSCCVGHWCAKPAQMVSLFSEPYFLNWNLTEHFALKPTRSQQIKLETSWDCCRHVWLINVMKIVHHWSAVHITGLASTFYKVLLSEILSVRSKISQFLLLNNCFQLQQPIFVCFL